jgi:hypothetical protein
MNILQILKSFNQINNKIDTINTRIKYLKKLLTIGDSIEDLAIIEYIPEPRRGNNIIARPTENSAIYREKNINSNYKMIKQEINRLKSIRFSLEFEIDKINDCINAMNPDESYILKCKYIYNMSENSIQIEMAKEKKISVLSRPTIAKKAKIALKKFEENYIDSMETKNIRHVTEYIYY